MSERKSPTSRRRHFGRGKYAPVALALAAFFCLTALAMGARTLLKSSPKKASAPKALRSAATPLPGSPTGGDAEHVRRGQLWPQLHGALTATGDRLEKPGKERQTLAGTITRGGSPPSPLTVVRDYPDLMRVEVTAGLTTRVTAFNGGRAQAGGAGLTPAERDTLETLVYDTADHFFHSQQSGAAATRFLGPRFRLDEGTNAAPAAPSYDVFETTEPVLTDDAGRVQTRRYYFNSDTRLLDRVRYQTERDGSQVDVEVVLGWWQSVNGQALPSSVVRLEDGAPVLTCNFALMTVGPRASPVAFGF